MKITAGPVAPTNAPKDTVYYNVKERKFFTNESGDWTPIPQNAEEPLYLILLGLDKYSLSEEGRWDVAGDVKVIGIWDKLPIAFGKIDGHFDCARTGLKSMVNMPSLIIGDFTAGSNKFISCDGMPVVCGRIDISGNKLLKDFRGLPTETTNDIDVSNCGVHSHYGLPKLIRGNLSATNNEFRTIPEGIEVHGDADFTSNKIITEQTGSKINGKIWLDDNPCTAENDNIKENAIWS